MQQSMVHKAIKLADNIIYTIWYKTEKKTFENVLGLIMALFASLL